MKRFPLLTVMLTLITALQSNAQDEKQTEVVLETTCGDIRILLYDDTPGHRDNFIRNVEDGMYDGVLFHRVIRNFMVQTGNPDTREGEFEKVEPTDTTQMGPSIPAEIRFPEHYHLRGVVAAAREGDDINPEKRSSKYQFYIVTGKFLNEEKMLSIEQSKQADKVDEAYARKVAENEASINQLRASRDMAGLSRLTEQLHEEAEQEVKDSDGPFFPDNLRRAYRAQSGAPWLDGDYTVFGEVTAGMKVVTKIEKAKTDKADKPIQDIRIIRAFVVR